MWDFHVAYLIFYVSPVVSSYTVQSLCLSIDEQVRYQDDV